MLRISRLGIFFILFLLVIFIFTYSYKPPKIIRLAGSTAFLPFAEKLAEEYMKRNPGIVVDVQGGGSAVGIMVAREGIADIGMVDMVILPKETERLEKVIVARDGIAVIVNNSNKVNDLTLTKLRDLFSGKITNWKEIGGDDAKIRVISREEGSGTRKSFDLLVLSGRKVTPDAMYQDSNGTIREAVKSDKDSIGYISIGILNPDVKALSIDGISANNENVKLSRYKIARPIYFLLKSNYSVQTRDFVNYILGTEAQKIMEKDGLITVI
ncbi:phosphate-binding protein [Candidatus Gottesmanbacteria bacterium CG11_big_fil_rev_8_21_14_0_20_37_11]|uniref:Phosphate-binding protein n=3 Tax=Candidatus Gottesmaniibacteriota TaxID=1752720 RepID=A0A2M7RTL9_9BACT|nr:MAG: hypothetical protein AUJ73_03250 [Candidatus Gottesmanbacteria bacterium CG1_02_37_22]PIP33317.1 MAG: phosphate-binding protein [Candidatus Gottesmanbacteria bacterium CG23_combo_of_CG06-09_8_20_14_all_37_19]PIR08823.1 MAG: phosphate-binding protein [Candidatus Gottesmanbacteria bacterium CG11_big_fil_rev_8_21_14_0_20_37_11]PIZ03324.1 MAG: phosphate-binding protein [Candidatus Gottesmanbacteria bacterium CG_4_10_14_0_8_um_filter_37_24]